MAITLFYRTLKDGRPRTIALLEEEAWRSLDTHWEYDDEERARWSVEKVEREVPLVSGIVKYWGGDCASLPHVHWTCPKCGQEHHTDLGPGEPNPALWFCEMGGDDAVFLVRWRRESGS